MKKILFIMALSLIQILHTNAEQTKNKHQMSEVANEIITEMIDSSKKIKSLYATNYRFIVSIYNTLYETKLYEVKNKLKQETKNYLAKVDSDGHCSKQAESNLNDFNKIIFSNEYKCLNITYESMKQRKKDLKMSILEVDALFKKISIRLYKCQNSHNKSDLDGRNNCLNQGENGITKKKILDMLFAATGQTMYIADEFALNIILQLEHCLENVKQNAENISQKYLEEMENCYVYV